jgi:hypothetical protein
VRRKSLHAGGGLALEAHVDMGVDIAGGGDVAAAQDFLGNLEVLSIPQQNRGAGVPQVVAALVR